MSSSNRGNNDEGLNTGSSGSNDAKRLTTMNRDHNDVERGNRGNSDERLYSDEGLYTGNSGNNDVEMMTISIRGNNEVDH